MHGQRYALFIAVKRKGFANAVSSKILLILMTTTLVLLLPPTNGFVASSIRNCDSNSQQKQHCSSNSRLASIKEAAGSHHEDATENPSSSSSRRSFLQFATAAISTVAGIGGGLVAGNDSSIANAAQDIVVDKQRYFQRFPSLFAPLYGESTKVTELHQVASNLWYLEQTLELGPLETPIRCTVIKLQDSTLWVHAPLAPTIEFFEFIENLGNGQVSHVVVPTYALEHKIFTKDALERWPNAQLWTAPGQFSFPFRSISDNYVFGKPVTGILEGSDSNQPIGQRPPWADEIEYETLEVGTFTIGGASQTFQETTFFHKSTKTLIVTDAVERVNPTPPSLNTPENLLLVSKRCTADPMPDDTPEARQIGWEKTALLVSYFFPEHEELDPNTGPGVVTWTDGWHDNFQALAGTNDGGKLIVPPVVRTLLYPENPTRVQDWVNRVSERWDFQRIIPAHFDAPIQATSNDLKRAFAFLDDPTIDPFPENDLARGLQPIADIVYRK